MNARRLYTDRTSDLRGWSGRAASLLAACAALLLVSPARAQVSALGRAGAYTLEARGVEAPSWNPATLAWNSRTEVRLFSALAEAGNNSISLNDYNRWIGTTWSDSDKREILSRIPGASFDGFFSASGEGPGVAKGDYAFTIENRAAGNLRLPRELARLFLFGNNPEETFELNGSGGEAFAWSEARLSYARELGRRAVPELPLLDRWFAGDSLDLAAGATVKYLHGWGYAEVSRADGGLTTTIDAITGEALVEGHTAEGGSGFGLDLGVAGRSPRGWAVSLDLHNLVSVVSWSRRPKLHQTHLLADDVTLRDMDNDDDVVTEETTHRPCASFRRSLPALLTLAAGKEWGATRFEMDLRQGFADRPGSSTRPRIAAGASYTRWSWLEPRAGLALGGAEGPTAAAGVGLGIWRVRLDLALASIGSWNIVSPKGIGAGVGLGIR